MYRNVGRLRRASFHHVTLAVWLTMIGLGLIVGPASATESGHWLSYPANGPVDLHSAIYDPPRQRMIAFGGTRSGGVSNTLYALSLAGATQTWTLLPANDYPAPDPRNLSSIVYDSARDRLLLFGGRTQNGAPLTDVWAFPLDGSQAWSLITTTNSPQIFGYDTRAIYDSIRDRLLVVDGAAEVWSLPLAGPLTWTPLTLGGLVPTLFFGFSAIYDPAGDQIVTFGGRDEQQCPPNYDGCNCGVICPHHCAPFCNFRTASTFALSGPNQYLWQSVTAQGGPPDWRSYHSAVYDATRGRMLVFGGEVYGWPDLYADTWELTLGATPTWTQLQPTGTAPSARSRQAAIYDPVRDQVVINGGLNASQVFAETWALSFDAIPPAAVTDLNGAGGCYDHIYLSWTAPGDDGTVGTATAYDLRWYTSTITDANFASANPIPLGAPQPAGTLEQITVSVPCGRRYYALKTRDDGYNWSALSNVISVGPGCPRPPAQCYERARPAPPPEAGPARAPATLELAAPQPNPSDGQAIEVRYGIPQQLAGVQFDLGVFDLVGRRIVTLERGDATVGYRSARLVLRGADGSAIGAGVYFVRLRAGGQVLSRRIVTVR